MNKIFPDRRKTEIADESDFWETQKPPRRVVIVILTLSPRRGGGYGGRSHANKCWSNSGLRPSLGYGQMQPRCLAPAPILAELSPGFRSNVIGTTSVLIAVLTRSRCRHVIATALINRCSSRLVNGGKAAVGCRCSGVFGLSLRQALSQKKSQCRKVTTKRPHPATFCAAVRGGEKKPRRTRKARGKK